MDIISVDTLEIENELKDEWEKEIKRLAEVCKVTQNLHVACLYCRTPPIGRPAQEAWTAIVKKVSASFGHWRELGIFLGLESDDLDYIEHSVTDDKTDTVLRVFMQNNNATIDKVADALVKMKRYDVLKAIEIPLQQINQHFKDVSNNSDAGYSSNSEAIIVTPKVIVKTLPEVLKKRNDDLQEESEEEPGESYSLTPLKQSVDLDKDKVTILLTYTEDGKETALAMPRWIANWMDDSLQVQFVTLNERRQIVMQNPEIVIQECIQQVDYIVPIVTEEYMDTITSKKADSSSSTDLDVKYVQFIFKQLLHKFSLIDSCYNKNVRCVIPSRCDNSIAMKLRYYQVLVPWTWQVDFDITFKDLIKKALENKIK